ncbi:CbtA family protein [Terrabacter aerolatus]|uniref:Membrane protein n=1 Tax=Terrabacter aerolatus TaxID=422442 RepID=A0A512CWC6_9MICO|nr:CbtA family protein [Terrabacter aerolatus]GEO28529.1 membrane protein [Terrabacter aerolatus]
MGLSFGSVLRRGVLAGMLAGLAAAVMIWLVVEPVIRRALVIEDLRSMHGGQAAPPGFAAHGGGEPLVSRTAQVVGGAVTSVVVGIAVGVIFAVVFARVRERLPGRGDFGRSMVLAAIGFAAVSLLPALKIPSNPPAVGDPSTVGRRTMLYAVVLLLGVAVAVVVPTMDRRLALRGVVASTRWALDVAAVVVLLALVLLLVPGSPDQVPADVPADLVWDFRLASLAQLATMWLALGLAFGLLMERIAARSRALRPVAS